MSTPLNASVLKGFEILGLLNSRQTEISTALVAESLKMNSSTAHRFLLSLEAAGALQSTRRGYFTLGLGLAALAQLAEDSNPVIKLVDAEIANLSTELRESVMACRLTAEGPACVAVATYDRPISVNIKIGTVLPILTSAQGKLWLADLEPAQRRQQVITINKTHEPRLAARQLQVLLKDINAAEQSGFAVNLGDNEPDIAAVSVPIYNAFGKMQLSISVFGMLSRFDEAKISTARQHLHQLAERVSAKLPA